MKKNCPALFVLLLLLLPFLLNFQLFCQETKIESSEYKARRDKLCSVISDGVAIMVNTSTRAGFGRNRPNSDFYYLTGVDVPDARLILVPEKVAKKTPNPEYWKSTLYLPAKDPRAGTWNDVQLFPGEEAMRITGIENTADLNAFGAAVSRLAAVTDVVYLAFGSGAASRPGASPDMPFVETVKRTLPSVRVKDLTPILGDLRWTKSPKEIEIMKRACAITAEAYKESARIAKPGVWEYQIDALCDYVFRRNGCDGNAFLIIGSGPNSCILHHSSNDRQMKDGDLVVIDIGAIYHATSTDLTRTIPVSGAYSPEQKKIYNIVLEAQKKAISMVRPGVTLAQLHQAAMDVIAKAGYEKYFIHFLSHTLNGGIANKPTSLGLSAKLVPNATNLAADKPLEPGCMFTIEPGIYIPEKNLGIRIEDDILVTRNGCEILTKDAPKEIDEIEKLMKEKPVIIIK